MKNKVTEFFRCDCASTEHQFVIDYWDGDDELIVSVHLNPLEPWYKRVWMAVRYVFGYTSCYGSFQEVILQRDQVDRLISVLNQRQTGKK